MSHGASSAAAPPLQPPPDGPLAAAAAAAAGAAAAAAAAESCTPAPAPPPPLSLLELLEPSSAVRVMLFLSPRDVARAGRASRAMREAAFEELVWRSLARRTFADLAPPAQRGFVPADASWVAEFKWRHDAVRRTAQFQRALVLGMAGDRRAGAPVRLVPSARFAAFECSHSEAGARRRAKAEAAAAAVAAGAPPPSLSLSSLSLSPAASALPPGARSTHDKIEAASRARGAALHGSRQGTATWSTLGGAFA
jgi:hypothetical protein